MVHASLHGSVSTLLTPVGTLLGSTSSAAVSLAFSTLGSQVSEPHMEGSPQQGKSVSDSKRLASAAASSSISGGGVGILLLVAA